MEEQIREALVFLLLHSSAEYLQKKKRKRERRGTIRERERGGERKECKWMLACSSPFLEPSLLCEGEIKFLGIKIVGLLVWKWMMRKFGIGNGLMSEKGTKGDGK